MQGSDEMTAAVQTESGELISPFNEYCLRGIEALEKIMVDMTKNSSQLDQLMSFISVVWAAHAANIMKNYVPPELHSRFRKDIMNIAQGSIDRMLEPLNIPDKKDMQ